MKKLFLSCIALIIVVFPSCAAIGMDNLPTGELIKNSNSPNKQYRIEVYLCSGNATTANSIRCAAVEINSQKSRNILWQYRQDDAEIEWLDDNNVKINGIKLNILTDSYDWREHTSLDDDLEYWGKYWDIS
ncbi:MAG: hypothetical protein IJ932_05895 [Ruminococcus sp.]|nr:hypothetical protein [Ruminococcus sp.]